MSGIEPQLFVRRFSPPLVSDCPNSAVIIDTYSPMLVRHQVTWVSSDNDTLRFAYTVQEGDSSADLDYASAGALNLNGGVLSQRLARLPVLTELRRFLLSSNCLAAFSFVPHFRQYLMGR